MAESGFFRTGIGGFRKDDVLKYVDEMESAHQSQLKELEEKLQKAEQEAQQAEIQRTELAASFQQENARLRLQTEELGRKNSELSRRLEAAEPLTEENAGLRTRVEELSALLSRTQEENDQERRRLTREAEELREALRNLEERSRQALTGREELLSRQKSDAARLRESEMRCGELARANARYAKLVGDVGSFIMEIRAMGQRFLEVSYKRGETCLQAVSGAVDSLEARLTQGRHQLEEARRTLEDQSSVAGLRLDEWIKELDDAVTAIEDNLSKDISGAVEDLDGMEGDAPGTGEGGVPAAEAASGTDAPEGGPSMGSAGSGEDAPDFS